MNINKTKRIKQRCKTLGFISFMLIVLSFARIETTQQQPKKTYQTNKKQQQPTQKAVAIHKGKY